MGRKRKTSSSMSAVQIKRYRQGTFKLSQVKMAAELGVSIRAYITYETGDMTVPEPIAKLVRCLADKR